MLTRGFVWLALSSFASGPSTHVPAPSDATEVLDMRVQLNDVPTHVQELHIRSSLRESLAFYRNLLGSKHIEFELPQGRLLGAPLNGRFVTVQLLTTSLRETRARISEADLNAHPASGESVALPPYSQVLSRIGSREGLPSSRTVLARAPSDLERVAAFFRESLRSNGYELHEQSQVQTREAAGVMQRYGGRGGAVDIVLVPRDGATLICAVLAESAP